MEEDAVRDITLTDSEKKALDFSLEIVLSALLYGWDIEIFQNDRYLIKLERVLKENRVYPNSFFDFTAFRRKGEYISAYDWSRAIIFLSYEKLHSEELEDEQFLVFLKLVDYTYQDEMNPNEFLNEEEYSFLVEYLNERVPD